MGAHLRRFERMQFEDAITVHVQIVLFPYYLTKVVGKEQVSGNEFV